MSSIFFMFPLFRFYSGIKVLRLLLMHYLLYVQVAPLEIHEENLIDVEDQLRFLIHVIQQEKISCFMPLLKGSISSWIWTSLGILVCPLIIIP